MNTHGRQTQDSRLKASPIAILGIPFDPVTTEQSVDLIADMVASRQPHYVVTANVDFVVQAQDDVELRRIIFNAHLVLCDGMPLVWASRHLGNPLPERVAGSDLMPRLLAESELRGWRVFLLGGTSESVERAAVRTLERHPRLNLVGAHSPPFRPLLEMDHSDIFRRVTSAKPDLLFVAFGCPKQEKWINMHYRHLGVPVCIGIGATIDFIAGTFRRAPVWMQRTGTEWLFRLAQEPRRLAGRYGRGLVVFGRAIAAQARQMRVRSTRSGNRPDPIPNPPPGPSSRPASTPLSSPSTPTPPIPSANADSPGGGVDPSDTQPAPLIAPARLDAAATRELGETWPARVEGQRSTVIDLGAAEFVDSTGVGLLVRLQKLATRNGLDLLLCRPRPQLMAALRLMRIEHFFRFSDVLPESPPRVPVHQPQPGPGPARASGTGLEMAWTGEITAGTVACVADAAEGAAACLPPGGRLTVDLAAVTFVDSSGLGFMVRLKKNGWRRDVAVTFTRPSEMVRRMFQVTRLEEYLMQEPSRPANPDPVASQGIGP